MNPPTRYALVLREGTQAVCHALAGDCLDDAEWETVRPGFQADWTRAIAASPNGGAVTAADLERAAEAHFVYYWATPWAHLSADEQKAQCAAMRAALTALGLPVADAREEAGNG